MELYQDNRYEFEFDGDMSICPTMVQATRTCLQPLAPLLKHAVVPTGLFLPLHTATVSGQRICHTLLNDLDSLAQSAKHATIMLRAAGSSDPTAATRNFPRWQSESSSNAAALCTSLAASRLTESCPVVTPQVQRFALSRCPDARAPRPSR